MNINFSSNVSFSEVIGLPEGANSVEFANAWNDAFVNARQAPYYSQETLDKMKAFLDGTSKINAAIDVGNGRWGAWDKYQFGNTDWEKEGYRRWQVNQKHTVSFNGGLPGGKLNYYASVGWNQDKGIMNKMLDDKYNRYNATLKLTSKINKWINVSLNSRYSRQASDRPNWGTGDYAYTEQLGGRVWPVVPFYNPDGTMPYNNPILRAKLNGNTIDNNDDMWTTGGIELTPIKGLRINGTYTWNVHSEDYYRPNKHITAITDYTDENGKYWYYEWAYQNYPNNVTKRFNKDTYHQSEVYANYDLSIKKHNLTFLAGYQEELKNYSLLYGYKTTLITEDVISISTAIGDSPSVDDDLSQWANCGYFGRFKYNYNEKYLFEFNGRYDASSRFPADTRWAFFPSASVAYNITKENFWKFDKINLLKLRANIGKLGNGSQNVGTYAYIPSMSISAKTSNVLGGVRVPAVSMPGLVSADLTWEKPRVVGFGVDLEAFYNRFSATYDWYQRTTFDQFGQTEELPEVLGASPPVKNNAVSETRGWELSLGWRGQFKVVGKPLNWSAHFVLSDYIGYVVSYENRSGNRSGTWTKGERFGDIYGYKVDKIAQSSDDFINGGASLHRLYNSYWFPGDLVYKDLDGNGMIDSGTSTWYNHGDLTRLGNSSPRYTYGLNLTADWNGFDLRMNFEGVGKQDIWFEGLFYQGIDRGASMWFSTFNKNSLDFWSPDNTDAFFPRPYMSSEYGSKFQVDDRYLTNGAYLRFKTLQWGYTLQQNRILTKLSVRNLRIYATAENIALMINKSHVKIDPLLVRNSGGRTYPPQRTFSLGLNVTF
jgi:TonB-linked SusC/RagA family outer membrane protein